MKNRFPKLTFEQVTLLFLVLLVTVISLTPFFKIGFTISDDLEYYLTFLKGDYYQDARIYANYSGRFYFLITKPLYSLVYATGSFVGLKILQYGCLLFAYFSFTYLIQKLFHSKKLSVALFVLLVCCTPATPCLHIPFIAYPCFFTVSFALFCWALILYVKYTETDRYALIIYSALLCFVSMLFYENYLVFVLLFGIAILIRNLYRSGIRKAFTTKLLYRELLPIAIAAILYVVLYFLFRQFVDNQYDGSSFAHPLNWKNFFGILRRCTFAVAPLHQFKHGFEVMSVNSQSVVGHFQNYRFMLTHASLAAYTNALVVSFLTAYFLKNFKNKLSWKALCVATVAAVIFAFSAHLLIAVSSKYNLEWGSWLAGYVTSFYSYFGVILAMLLIGYALYKLVFRVQYLRTLMGAALVLSLFGIVVIDTSTNEHISHEWARSQQRFTILDEMIADNAFSQMGESDILYCPSMYQSGLWGNSLFGININRMNEYILLKSGKQLSECENMEQLKELLAQDSTRRVLLLDMKEGMTHNDMLVTMTSVKPSSWNFSSENPLSDALCDSATLYFHSASKRYLLMLNRLDTDSAQAILGGKDTVWLTGQWNRIPIACAYWQHKRPVSVVRIQSPDMKASDFYISDLSERFPERHEIAQP
jgi:hypothetical protein